jgi:hypothetical protein
MTSPRLFLPSTQVGVGGKRMTLRHERPHFRQKLIRHPSSRTPSITRDWIKTSNHKPGFPHWYMPLQLLLKIRLSHSSSATMFRVEICEIHVVTTSTCPPSMQTNRLECLCVRSSPLLVSRASHASGKPPGLWPKPIMHTSQRCDWLMRALALLRKPSRIKPW